MKIFFNSHNQAADLYKENLVRKFGKDILQSVQARFSGGSINKRNYDANTLESTHLIDSNETYEWLNESESDGSDENFEEIDIENVNDNKPPEVEPIMEKEIEVNSENTDQLTIEQLRQKLDSLTKSLTECKANNNDLIQQLIAVTDEHDRAVLNTKIEFVKLKEDYAREIMALNEKRSQEVAAAKTEMEKYKQDFNTNLENVIEEICRAEDQLKTLCMQLKLNLESRI